MTNNTNVEDIRERLIALTRDLILIPSIVTRPDDRLRCYESVKNHLESIDGIEVREFSKDGFPSLVAAPKDCQSPEILMCGHIDVIAHEDIIVYKSAIEDGKIYGPGSGDMKGSVAILIEVFRYIHSNHPGSSLGIAITTDEETGGEAGIGYLIQDEGLSCQCAMIPDGGSLNSITIEEKGILHLKLEAHGNSAHAARPWLGDNPIVKLQSGLFELKKYFDSLIVEDDHWYPTCSLTIIGTENQTINRIPINAYAILDIRFPPPFTVENMIEQVQSVLGNSISVEVIINAKPTHLSPDPLYKEVTESITGKTVQYIKDDGGSDARFLALKGIPVLMSRPLVGNLHSTDEWIDIDSMVQFYQIYETYLTKKFKK